MRAYHDCVGRWRVRGGYCKAGVKTHKSNMSMCSYTRVVCSDHLQVLYAVKANDLLGLPINLDPLELKCGSPSSTYK